MGEAFVDLHAHTTASDGDLSPAELVHEASAAGLGAIAVTDHDTIGARAAAERAAGTAGIELVRGIELTCYLQDVELHILGLLLEEPDDADRAMIERIVRDRRDRAEKMVALCRAGGCLVTMDHVLEKARQADGSLAAIGRPHVAQALVAAGDVGRFGDAFRKWIAPGRPAYVTKTPLSPAQAIGLIHRMGGLAALAHPGVYKRDDLVPALVDADLDAIEVWHTLHAPDQTRRYTALARQLGLSVTGGSDFHGPDKMRDAAVGAQQIPAEVLDALKERKAGKRK